MERQSARYRVCVPESGGSLVMGDFGERLRQARLRTGLSLREISVRTKIREPLLDAIEREDFGRLPAGILGRGFLRAYAREVGLDPESIVQQFQDQIKANATPTEAPLPEAARESDHAQRDDSTRLWRRGFLIVAAQAVICGGIVHLRYYGSDIDATPGSDPVASGASPDVSPASFQLEADAVERRPPELAAPAVNTSREKPLAVVIHPIGLVWVEATADGSRVLYQLVESGQRRSIDVREELLLRIGDAGAFRFSIDGVPGRVLGGSGEVRDIRITSDDYSSFQAR